MTLRSTYAEIDLSALMHNFLVVRQYAPQAKVLAVIKADAYGHGMLQVASALAKIENGPDAFAVACVDEAIELSVALQTRRLVKPIIVLEGFNSAQELDAVLEFQLIPVINNISQIDLLIHKLSHIVDKAKQTPLSFWIKLDTGMHRLGFQTSELIELHQKLKKLLLLNGEVQAKLACIMSHFCCADEINNKQLTEKQLAIFEQQLKSLDLQKNANLKNVDKSFANSAAIVAYPNSHFQWVRPGIMLYGVDPLLESENADSDLLAVMTLKSKIIAINHLKKGDCIGYGREWCCPEDMSVGVVAIGYGDGYPRHATSGTPVLVNGLKTQLLGRVSMDMISIDLRPLATKNTKIKIGDSVTLWGKGLAVEEVAQFSTTIGYELLCSISKRVKYVYTK